jgi:hypothetical protein
VREGRFHIYGVSSIDEGIEILTGVRAGERGPDGRYPEGSVYFLVEQALEKLAGSLKGFYVGLLDGSPGL